MKRETKEKIKEVLRQDVNDRKDRMLHMIDNNYDIGLDVRIEEYRTALKALEDFEEWLDEEDK